MAGLIHGRTSARMAICAEISAMYDFFVEETSESIALLKTIPGGRELIDWFSGAPDFCNAEIVGLYLDRSGAGSLVIEIRRLSGVARITFILGHWIDVHLMGFSHQNVIGGLTLRRVTESEIARWQGAGVIPGDTEIVLEPRYGANGIIRGTVLGVLVEGA
jgi:hypothetical protein